MHAHFLVLFGSQFCCVNLFSFHTHGPVAAPCISTCQFLLLMLHQPLHLSI
ncbi:hypothetical protein GLYMA_19G158000v4 [Glycine max]|nr:hypothetical protein GLYMA_19G158000v4 [Glycine max]KAH1078018.1 hypothetical protein GYH30_053195 [Glycine max]